MNWISTKTLTSTLSAVILTTSIGLLTSCQTAQPARQQNIHSAASLLPEDPNMPRKLLSAWNVSVTYDHNKKPSRSTYTLWDDGSCENQNGSGVWKVDGDFLVIRWPDKNTAGGAWIDVLVLDKEKKSFKGANQVGMIIEGRRQ